jgi:hypothetical protein
MESWLLLLLLLSVLCSLAHETVRTSSSAPALVSL